MDLHSDSPFWLLRSGLLRPYRRLTENITTEVAIIGAGITGALVGYHLAKAGVGVVLLDRRHVGTGSTSASTALLQYEIDTPLRELAGLVGEAHAVRSYHLCLQAIGKLEKLAAEVGEADDFRLTKSFFYASRAADVPGLRTEFELRRRHGIGLEWLEKEEIVEKFGFAAPAGLLSDTAAETDAYRLAHALLRGITEKGGAVHDKTEVADIAYSPRRVTLTTADGCTVRADRLVIAAGYEAQRYLKQPVELLRSTYAVVSEPLATGRFWHDDCLIWETAHPYLYLRTTPDRRILIGGKDEAFYDPARRDKLITRKTKALVQAFEKKFPHLPFRPDYQWAGTFSETKDGLPYIGLSPERPLTYFALGFGGNGITFSLIAAEIIRDLYLGRRNPDVNIFAFDR